MNSYIVLDNGLSLSIGMQPYNVDRTHPNFDKIVEAVKADEWDSIPDLIDIVKSVVAFGNGRIEVNAEQGTVAYNGEELHSSLTDRILGLMSEGFTIEPLTKFLDNLMENTSKRAVDELYGFLEYGKMPITEDGHFLAYKRVRADYRSVHDGKTDNSIGNIVEMPRNKVDENKDETCSHGLHFCSHGYLSQFSGDRVVVLKINPRDVVAIPSDYNNTKGRACRYEVVGELSPAEVEKALFSGLWKSTVITDYDDADRDFSEDDILDDDEDNLEDDARNNELEDILGMAASDRQADADAEVDPSYGRYLDRKPAQGEVSEEQSLSYVNGYNDGYKDGHDKDSFALSNEEDIERCGPDTDGGRYAAGYVRGFKHGRGHRAKVKFNVAS